jgi:hypothetical protein
MMPRLTAQNWASRLLVASLFGAMIAAMSWVPARAQDDEGAMDEKALTVLKGMSDYLGDSETISFRAKTFFDVVLESGIKIKTGRASTVLLRRPKDLYIEAETDDGSATTIWFDGKKLTLWRRDANQVMSLDFEGNTDAMLDHVIEEYDAQIPLADLFYSNVKKTLGEDLLSAAYVGLRTVGGVPCHQLSFESPGADWQIWIEADSTPVPRRFVIDFVGDDNKPQFMAQMDAWSIGGDMEDYNFVAAVPDSVEEVEFKLKP